MIFFVFTSNCLCVQCSSCTASNYWTHHKNGCYTELPYMVICS